MIYLHSKVLTRRIVYYSPITGFLRFVLILTASALLLDSGRAQAWSWKAHVAMAEVLYQSLPLDLQKQFDADAESLFEVHQGFAKKLSKSYPGRSAFVRSAVIPDLAKRQSLRGLAERSSIEARDLKMPAFLMRHATRDYHYQNTPHALSLLSRLGLCFSIAEGRLDDALLAFSEAYVSKQSLASSDSTAATENGLSIPVKRAEQRQAALKRAFIVHLLQDAAQPLHQYTSVTNLCKHDRGGNDTCFKRKKSSSECSKNLHERWDYVSPKTLASWKKQALAKLIPFDKSTAKSFESETELIANALAQFESESFPIVRAIYGAGIGNQRIEKIQAKAMLKASSVLQHFFIETHNNAI